MVRVPRPIVLLVLSLFVLPAVLGETLYKWVDDQGNVHYSDKPQPGAKKMHIPTPTTFTPPSNVLSAPPAPAEQPQTEAGYSQFEIGSPTAEQVLWNVDSVTVSIALQPGLHRGDLVTITVDDKSQGPSGALTATFSDLDRGTHTVSATLQETDGSSMIAKPVTFYIQRGTQKGFHIKVLH